MLVVNLYGVPSAGKSTGAAYIFSKLKMYGINAELVTEFAKDKVYEGSKEVFNNQAYIFGKQYFKLSKLEGKVDVAITDSPLLLSVFYNSSKILGSTFNRLVREVSDSYKPLNYLLTRVKPYNPSGRFQTEEESNAMAVPMKEFLDVNKIHYTSVKGNLEGYEIIIEDIIRSLKENGIGINR